MLGTAAFVLGSPAAAVGECQLLQPAEPVVDGRLGELHASGQLAQVELRILAAPARHLSERGGQAIQSASRLEPLDGGRLAEAGADRFADVCGLEVQPAVDLAADLAHDADV